MPADVVARDAHPDAFELDRPSDRPHVLVVDPEPPRAASVVVALHRRVRIEAFATVPEALGQLPSWRPTVVALDPGSEYVAAVALVHAVRRRAPACHVVVTVSGPGPGWRALVELADGILPGGDPAHRHLEAIVHGLPAGGRLSLSGHVAKAIDHIAAHCGERLSVDSIARAVGVSGGRLAHLFPLSVGMTVKAYVTGVRVEMAKFVLRRSDRKLKAVAADTGFYDASHLCRVFRRRTGAPPHTYRQAEAGSRPTADLSNGTTGPSD